MSRQMKAQKNAREILEAILIPLASMPKDAHGNVVQMTVDEILGTMPDLRYGGGRDDGVPHGSGKLTHPTGFVWTGDLSGGKLIRGLMSGGGMHYEGEFLNLWPHGEGQSTRDDGCEWSGQFRYGLPVQGRAYVPGAGVYEGAFHEGHSHGNGKLTNPSGQVWEGYFDHGELREGTHTVPNGVFEEGTFCDYHLHGKGHRVFPDRAECEGGFRHGKQHGFGTYLDPTSDSIIEGEWRDGECVDGKHIQGDLEYEGRMADGFPHGSGRLKVGDGVMEGSFDGFALAGAAMLAIEPDLGADLVIHKSGKTKLRSLRSSGHELVPSPDIAGTATLKFPGGRSYDGHVLHGQAHGAGELTIPGVGTCNGAFVGGILEGKVVVNFASGATLTGTFRSGLPNGTGNYKAAGGAVYIGNFDAGLPCGPGALFVPANESHTYISFEVGQAVPPCPGFVLAELLRLREALAHSYVAFPTQVVIEAIQAKGKGLRVERFASRPLPPGGEPFSVVLIPEETAASQSDEAEAA